MERIRQIKNSQETRDSSWSLVLPVLLAISALSCQTPTGVFCDENPDDLSCDQTIVSETEVWRLELEQLQDDNGPSSYPRRGTITMRLRLNRTTQPDPTCEGRATTDVTTFLADVEVFASRLQSVAATGAADGSWNCHGFAATVRLSDGTQFELQSEHTGSPAEWSWGRDYDVRWTAGARSGVFSLREVESSDFGRIRESHLDVLVQNRTGGEAWVKLDHPVTIANPFRIDYRVSYPAPIPVDGTANFSWPAHSAIREHRDVGYLPSVDLEGRAAYVWGPGANDDWYEICFLAPDHGNQVQLIITEDGPECGDGWFDDGLFLEPARRPLFIEPGTEPVRDTVTIVVTAPDDVPDGSTELAVVNTDPRVTGALSGQLLTITVAPETPPGERGVWVIGRLLQSGTVVYTDTTFVPVYVYELDLATAADTLTIAPGGSDTTSVLIDGAGFVSDTRLRATDLPAGIVQSVTFDPPVTDRFLGAGSVVTVEVADSAPPGPYDLTLCAMLVADPLATCHLATLTLVVLENTAPVAMIDSPADDAQFAAGASIEFTGTATDAEDGVLNSGDLVWTSSIDGMIGIGSALTRSDLSVGTHTITLTATDAAGSTGSANVVITIAGPNGTTSISGRVTGNGYGVVGATLTLTGPVSETSTSGDNGYYEFTDLPAGTYTITVIVDLNIDFPANPQTVTLGVGEAATVDFAGTY